MLLLLLLLLLRFEGRCGRGGGIEISSKDSVRLEGLGGALSIGYVAIMLATELGVSGSVSDDSETEWKDETDDAGTWFPFRPFSPFTASTPPSGG